MANVERDQMRDDRLVQYGARPLDQSRWILIRTNPAYARTYSGQVATLVAANLIGRISRSVAIDGPDAEILRPLPQAGGDLVTEALSGMLASDPQGRYERWSAQCQEPYLVHLGPNGNRQVVHGAGWLAYLGPPVSPLPREGLDPYNPVGPAFAAIAATTHLFIHRFIPPRISRIFDCYSWSSWDRVEERLGPPGPTIPDHLELGDVWTIGCGSVGSAVLYFLGLSGAHFAASLFDMKNVGLHNITRSPLFTERDVGQTKVRVVSEFLQRCGLDQVLEYPLAFDEAGAWAGRPAGTPDLLIPAANERNVRGIVEAYYPPLQIYGTTGSNWQASVVAHVPSKTGCSRCLFPDEGFPKTACATHPEDKHLETSGDQVDSSLPFLSFAAGLMAAADILKVASHPYPYLGRRGMFLTWDEPRLTTTSPRSRPGCPCYSREESLYRTVLEGSRYNPL